MGNNALINCSMPSENAIDCGAYTASLALEARRLGFIDETVLETIQTALLSLLRDHINDVTKGENSSIPAEIGDALMDGIGYCVDFALKNVSSVEDGILLLKTKSIPELYQIGVTLLASRAQSCEALLSRVRATRTKTVNIGYNIVLDTTFPDFIIEWKQSKYPHDFMVITEYPLAFEYEQNGIAGVHARMSALALENRFCARYASETDMLLNDYAHMNRVSPADAYVNLFTILLQNLLYNRLLNRSGITLTPTDLTVLRELLMSLDSEHRRQKIVLAASELVDACNFENAKLDSYILAAAHQLADQLNVAGGKPDALVVIHDDSQVLFHIDGDRLEDDAFAIVADEILLCDTAAEKIAILREELHSLADLCDMLETGCIYDEEYDQLFQSFDASTCGLLLTRLSLTLGDQDSLMLQGSLEWQLHFVSYVNDMDILSRTEIMRIYYALMH